MNVVDPRGLTPMEWCDYTGDNLSSVASPMKVDSDDDWRAFGDYVLGVMRRRGDLVPDQAQFASFEEWAMRFNQIIATIN